jgi:Ca-activated chloride channel family protein
MGLAFHPELAAAGWRFASPQTLLLLGLAPLMVVADWAAFLRQRRALTLFAGSTPQETRPSARHAIVRLVLVVAGCSFLIIAIARPQADPIEEDTTIRGRDIVFLVDVSRSMLSQDVVPNRLERAKLWIKDLTKTLRGDRVGLVAFAGVPVVQCPLTLDYGFFQMSLDELSPATSPRGGTLIGDAIRKTLSEVFEPGVGRYRDIVLITDGEDQGSFPVEAAKKAGETGVRIIAIGIGSELQGSPVPEKEGGKTYVEYEGQQVRSRLDSSTLAKITAAAAEARGDTGGGIFLNVGTGTIDLDKVYHDLIAIAAQRETQIKANVVYRELFPYFLALALACLVVEPLIPVRVRNRSRRRARIPTAAAAGLLMVCFPSIARGQSTAATPQTTLAAQAQDPASLYNSGRDLFEAGKLSEAAEAFRSADRGATDPELSSRARFNLGQALLKQATSNPKAEPAKTIPQLEAAAKAFRAALAIKPGDTEAAKNVEIARRLMKDAQKQQEQQDQQSDKNQEQKQDQSKPDQKNGNQDQQNRDARQHQDNADALKDLAQRQSQAADRSGEAQKQQDKARQDAKTQESKAAQSDVNKDTQQERQKLDSSSASKDAGQRVDEAQKEQRAASQALDQGDTKAAEDHQRKASELLQQAADAEKSAAGQAQQKQQRQDAGQQAKDEEPKHDQTAAQLLDKERRQREARQQVLRALKGKPQPVDKDW